MAEVAVLNDLKAQAAPLVLERLDVAQQELDSAKAAGKSKKMCKELIAAVKSFENLLPRAVADSRKKGQREVDVIQTAQRKQKAQQSAMYRSDGMLWADVLRTQRKIHSLMAHEGQGNSFRYHMKLSETPRFKTGDRIYLTEKWDGTTMQATNCGCFKRFDNFKKGDRRKHKASEQERYRLEKIDFDEPENAHIAAACKPYLQTFSRLPDRLCLYFEACGPQIGARFRQAVLADTIRVFDVSREGDDDYLPFADTIRLCDELGLPIVHYTEASLDLHEVCALLTVSPAPRYHGVDAELEGFVVRDVDQQGRIAKIRVDDMAKIAKEAVS
eukprot:g1051.t1